MIKVKSLYELLYNIYFVLDIGSWIISRQKVHFSSPVSHTKNIVRYDTVQCSKIRKKFVKTIFFFWKINIFWKFFPTERLQKRQWNDEKNFKNIDFSLFVLALKHTLNNLTLFSILEHYSLLLYKDKGIRHIFSRK